MCMPVSDKYGEKLALTEIFTLLKPSMRMASTFIYSSRHTEWQSTVNNKNDNDDNNTIYKLDKGLTAEASIA